MQCVSVSLVATKMVVFVLPAGCGVANQEHVGLTVKGHLQQSGKSASMMVNCYFSMYLSLSSEMAARKWIFLFFFIFTETSPS